MNVIKDFTQAWSDRLGNPLIPAIAIALALRNWDAGIYLFSDMAPDEKVAKIRNLVSASNIGWPLGVAVLYVVVAPIVARAIVIWREIVRGFDEDQVIAAQTRADSHRDKDAFSKDVQALEACGFSVKSAYIVASGGIRDHSLYRLSKKRMTLLATQVPEIWDVAARWGNMVARANVGKGHDYEVVDVLRKTMLAVFRFRQELTNGERNSALRMACDPAMNLLAHRLGDEWKTELDAILDTEEDESA